MRRLLFYLFFILLPVHITTMESKESFSVESILSDDFQLYAEMELEDIVNYTAFSQALAGYHQIDRGKDIMTLIDFSKPSTEERLYVFDMRERKLLFCSHVSHGRNSGGNYATGFSNKVGSYKSSLGFYLTEKTYTGKNGYSLVLDGLEEGINHRAKERAIVIHGAPYSNPSVISGNGRLGRSLGCPALPQSVSKSIIDTIKEGSVLFIYADNAEYLEQTSFIS